MSRSDLPVDTIEMARYLIGKLVVRRVSEGTMCGLIVETEAYPIGDSAGHGFRGETMSNRSLFLDRGYAYVYLAYGTYFMLNVSSERAGVGAGILIRALQPLYGLALMTTNQRGSGVRDLARGPGRLAAALRIDKSLDGVDMCSDGPLVLAHGAEFAPLEIGTSGRIGLSRDIDRLLRFYVRGSAFVSGPKALNR